MDVGASTEQENTILRKSTQRGYFLFTSRQTIEYTLKGREIVKSLQKEAKYPFCTQISEKHNV